MSLLNFGKIVFVSGFEKNCGKTTFLNYLLSKHNHNERIFCISVGLDNSKIDFLNTTPKPKLKIKKNWHILTNSLFLNNLDFPYRVIDVMDYDIAGGRPVIISPLIDCTTNLATPGSNEKVYELINSRFSLYDRIFIDGSFDRITQLSLFDLSTFYYVFSVKPSNIDVVANKIKFISLLMKVDIKKDYKKIMDEINDERYLYHDTLFIKGALTYSKIDIMDEKVKKIVLLDFTKVFIDLKEFISLANKYKIYFLNKFNLSGYVINLYDINRKEFEKNFDKSLVNNFIYNPYEN